MKSMKSILFCTEIADDLNAYVADKIAPHLFLSCHYEPETSPVFSADAKYIRGVMNLYKFIYDCSIAGRLDELARRCRFTYKKQELSDLLNIIQALRTVEGHNAKNGEAMEQHTRWCQQTIGKDNFASLQDYEKAEVALEKMGVNLCNILHGYIRQASICRDKENLIIGWENLILAFYAKKGNARIFEKELADAYQSRCGNAEISSRQTQSLRHKIARWCRNYYLSEDEKALMSQMELLRRYSGKLSAQQRKQVEIQAENSRRKIFETNHKIAGAMRCNNPEQMNDFIYMEYYFSNIRKSLKEVLIDMKREGKGTMLPEDLMQRLIERDFGEITETDY